MCFDAYTLKLIWNNKFNLSIIQSTLEKNHLPVPSSTYYYFQYLKPAWYLERYLYNFTLKKENVFNKHIIICYSVKMIMRKDGYIISFYFIGI